MLIKGQVCIEFHSGETVINMENRVEREAKQLTVKLLENVAPVKNPAAIILKHVKESTKNEVSYQDPQSISLLATRGVIRVINTLKADRMPGYYAYKVSFRRDQAEEFLYVISLGNFEWDKRQGRFTYNDKSVEFKRSSGLYKLIDLFMENPNEVISVEELIKTYGEERVYDPKRQANDHIRDIKAPLSIPKKHFQPGDGYMFRPFA